MKLYVYGIQYTIFVYDVRERCYVSNVDMYYVNNGCGCDDVKNVLHLEIYCKHLFQ